MSTRWRPWRAATAGARLAAARAIDLDLAVADDGAVASLDQTPFESVAPGRPATRAKFLQQWIACAERTDAAVREGLVARIGADARRRILTTSPLSWLPIELDLQVVDAVAESLGPERFSALSHRYFLEIMPAAPLGALLDIGIKLIGLSPQSFVRWWAKGWGAVYRSCGSVKGVFDAEGLGRLVHLNMPRVCVQSDAFVEAMLGAAHGVYELTGVQGKVRLLSRRVADGAVEIELDWRGAASITSRRL